MEWPPRCPVLLAQCIFVSLLSARAAIFRAATDDLGGPASEPDGKAGYSAAGSWYWTGWPGAAWTKAIPNVVPDPIKKKPWVQSGVKQVFKDLDNDVVPDPNDHTNQTTAYISGVEINGEGDTSVFILCFVFSTSAMLLFTITFSCLRKCFVTVYSRPHSEEFIEGVGYVDWMGKAFYTSGAQIIETAGLDGWTLVEFHSLNMRMFFALSIILMPILCPLHWVGHTAKEQHDMLSRLDIGNMKTNSDTSRFWIHAALVWVVVIVTMAFLQRGHRDFADKRRTWLMKMQHPRSCTLLVDNIPKEFCSDRNLAAYFGEMFPGNVERTYICRQTDALQHAVKLHHESEYKLHVAEARYERSSRPEDHAAVEACQRKKAEASARVDRERGRVEVAAEDGDPLCVSAAGFVTFNSRITRRFATDQNYTDNPQECQVELAPEPTDVLYTDLTASAASKAASQFMGAICLTALFIFWSPIVVFISGLTDLDTLKKYVPTVERWCAQSPILEILLGQLLTTLALKIFMWFLPGILFSIIRKFFSHKAGAHVQVTMERWYFYFLFIFVVLVTLVGRSLVITVIAIMEHPTQIFGLLAASMPGTSHFYLGYLVLAWPFPAFPLLRFMVCLKYIVFRYWHGLSPELAKHYAEPEDEAYNGLGSRMGVAVLKTTIALSLCTCCPIICLITCIYFAVSRFVTGFLVVYMEEKRPDIGGVMGMEALRQSIFGLVLYVFLMVGVLLKQSESVGPPLTALAALWPLYEGYTQINARAWECLSLEREIYASHTAGDRKTSVKYIQAECNPQAPSTSRPSPSPTAPKKSLPGDLLARRVLGARPPR